jgi:hypothetical protein
VLAGGEIVGVEVRHGDLRDMIIAPAETPSAALSIDGSAVVTDAPLTILRFSGEDLTAAQATGGTVLRVDGREIALRPEVTGTIIQSSGGYQAGSQELLAGGLTGDPPANRPVLVEHGDGRFSLMRAAAMEPGDGLWRLQVAEPPDFTVDGETTAFHYYPVREIDGRPKLRIQPLSVWTRE